MNNALNHPDYGKHHLVIYNGKIVSMSYIENVKDQFKFAGMRVRDNGSWEGFIITPKAEVFLVGTGFRKAIKLSEVEASEVISRII